MRKVRLIFYFLIPLFYIGTIFFLMIFQFSKNESFSQSFGELSISGRISPALKRQEVLDLQVHSACLKFFFSAKKSITITTEDGVMHSLRPMNWSERKNGFEISFQYHLKLVFEKKGEDGRTFVIQPLLSSGLRKIEKVSVPFSTEQGFSLKLHPYIPLIEANKGRNRFIIALDGGQDSISENLIFHLNVHDGKTRAINLEQVGEKDDPINVWLETSVHQSPESIINSFWNKAYAAWQGDRFQPSLGWDLGEGTKTYYEPLISAYLCEALNKGEYLKAFSRVISTPRPSLEWSFEAMPYLGNLIGATMAKRQQFEVLSSQNTINWKENLWLQSLYYAPEAYIARLEKSLLTGEIPNKVSDLLAFFANFIDLREKRSRLEGLNARTQLLLMLSLRHILRHEGKLYFVHDDGWLDLRSTLLLSKLLLKYAEMEKNSVLQALGNRLLLSALSYQDKTGFLPEILVLDQGKVFAKEGLLRPEDFYPLLLTRNPVQEIPLDSQGWSKRAFIRTPAALVTYTISPESAKFTLRFPLEAIEHLVIHGLPSFDHILLHGIRWRTDPEFQRYSDGWYYQDSTQTLYVKIKHRVEEEDLVIQFQP